MNKMLGNQKGIGLVEVIAALGISVVVITSLLSLTLFSLRTSLQSTLLMEATKAANKQMELLRAFRDSRASWEEFLDVKVCTTSPEHPCSISPSLTRLDSAYVVDTGGTQITVEMFADPDATAGDALIHAKVRAHWRIGGQDKYTYVYTDFTNWQNK